MIIGTVKSNRAQRNPGYINDIRTKIRFVTLLEYKTKFCGQIFCGMNFRVRMGGCKHVSIGEPVHRNLSVFSYTLITARFRRGNWDFFLLRYCIEKQIKT